MCWSDTQTLIVNRQSLTQQFCYEVSLVLVLLKECHIVIFLKALTTPRLIDVTKKLILALCCWENVILSYFWKPSPHQDSQMLPRSLSWHCAVERMSYSHISESPHHTKTHRCYQEASLVIVLLKDCHVVIFLKALTTPNLIDVIKKLLLIVLLKECHIVIFLKAWAHQNSLMSPRIFFCHCAVERMTYCLVSESPHHTKTHSCY